VETTKYYFQFADNFAGMDLKTSSLNKSNIGVGQVMTNITYNYINENHPNGKCND